MISRLCLAVMLAALTACSTDAPVTYESRDENWRSQSRVPQKYGAMLERMTSEERVRFYALGSDRERDLFIEEHGINVRKMLDDLLTVGMPASEVRQVLGPPRYDETMLRDIRDETWIYYRFNGYRVSRYMVFFREGRVVGWEAFSD